MLRHLEPEFLGGNLAPRGQDPLHLLAADERTDRDLPGRVVLFHWP